MIPASDYRRHVHATNGHYALLEQRIDNAIRNAAALGRGDGHPIRVTTEGVDRVIVDAVVADYATGGWTVTVHSDYRDGDYVELRSKP
jgi:hypothetical protein